jgi:hypothetical protein
VTAVVWSGLEEEKGLGLRIRVDCAPVTRKAAEGRE